ncbi:MAG TPA: carboxypeptidase-like regulatory domain-containing protein, partial [Vicinamibacterales bacterium]
MTAHRSPVARLALVLLTPIALVAQQSRDAARPLTGAASLSGIVVTDEAGDRPVRRATVTLSIPGDARSPRIVATDDEGRFAFGGLPGGNFTLSASKPGYVT